MNYTMLPACLLQIRDRKGSQTSLHFICSPVWFSPLFCAGLETGLRPPVSSRRKSATFRLTHTFQTSYSKQG